MYVQRNVTTYIQSKSAMSIHVPEISANSCYVTVG